MKLYWMRVGRDMLPLPLVIEGYEVAGPFVIRNGYWYGPFKEPESTQKLAQWFTSKLGLVDGRVIVVELECEDNSMQVLEKCLNHLHYWELKEGEKVLGRVR